MEFDNENSRCVSAGPEPDARVKMAATALMESIKKGVKPGCWPGVLAQIADAMWADLDNWEPVPTPETPEVHP